MPVLKETFDVSRKALYTRTESLLDERKDFRVTERHEHDRIRAVGGRDISIPILIVLGVVGIALLYAFWPAAVFMFIGFAAFYFRIPTNSITVEFKGTGIGKSSLSLTAEGKDAKKVSEIIAVSLKESLKNTQ